MLSVEFLRRGVLADQWTAAGMTADGVRQRVTEVSGGGLGQASSDDPLLRIPGAGSPCPARRTA